MTQAEDESRRHDPLRGWAPIALGVIALLGLALRLPDFLGYWLNPDEGIYYSVATWPSWSRFWTEIASNVHPPLYFVVIRLVSAVSVELSALRAPSLLAGIAAIVALYLATRELAGTPAALAAAMLTAVAEGAIVQSQVIRPYTTMLAVLGLALWFLARFVHRRRTADLVGWSVVLTLAALLHYACWLAAFAMAAGVGVLVLAGRLPLRDAGRLAVAHLPAGIAVVALWYVHVSTSLVGGDHLRTARTGWLQPYFHGDLEGLWEGLVGLMRHWFGASYDALGVVVLAIGLVAVLARRQLLLASVALVALGVAALLTRLELFPFGQSRHSMYLMVFLLPCMAIGLETLVGERHPWRLALAVGLVVLAFFPEPLRGALGTREVPGLGHVEQVTTNESVEAMAPRLTAARAQPGVVVVDEQTYFTLMPFFHPARLQMRTLGADDGFEPRRASHIREDGVVSLFRWGEADVVVSHTWRLRTKGRAPAGDDHVFGFLALADEAFPELAIAERNDAALLFAGWGAAFYPQLSQLDARLGGGCVSDLAVRRGIGAARLDPSRCATLLARRRPERGAAAP